MASQASEDARSDGRDKIPNSGSSQSDGGDKIPNSGSSQSDGETRSPTSGSSQSDGGDMVPTSGSSQSDGGALVPCPLGVPTLQERRVHLPESASCIYLRINNVGVHFAHNAMDWL